MTTVYITAPRDAAADIARSLVERRLAACVNRFDCESVYRWDGAVQEDSEVVLLAKTTDGAYDRLVEHVEREHPDEVPCVERFDETDALDAFGVWVAESVD